MRNLQFLQDSCENWSLERSKIDLPPLFFSLRPGVLLTSISPVLFPCVNLGMGSSSAASIQGITVTFGLLLLSILKLTRYCQGTELTFELPDRDRECFFQDIEKGTECSLEYQVSRLEKVFLYNAHYLCKPYPLSKP